MYLHVHAFSEAEGVGYRNVPAWPMDDGEVIPLGVSSSVALEAQLQVVFA